MSQSKLEERNSTVVGYEWAIEDASNKEFIIDDVLGYDSEDSVLGKIKSEIANETIDAVLDYLNSRKHDLEISIEEQESEIE